MFDIGFFELLVIAVVSLVILGPERLPVAMRKTAQTIRAFKASFGNMKESISQELQLGEIQQEVSGEPLSKRRTD